MFARRIRRTLVALALPVLAAGALAGCQDISDFAGARAMSPVSASLKQQIAALNMDVRSPIMLRIFKEESTLEVWKEDRSGKMKLLEEYSICAWSGKLGPKVKEGDRQAPEGFYTVTPGHMNPNSSYYLAFNIGFPNAYDRSLKRTGSNIMVHGDCSSRGCFSMTDEQIEEIYVLAREAFAGGQRGVQVQAFPFRMTAENMARHDGDENMPFWQMLKDGSDHFEVTNRVPRIDVCGKKYVFNASGGSFRADADCPTYAVDADVERLVVAKRDADMAKTTIEVAELRAKAERDRRWAEREKALAKLLNGKRDVDTKVAAIDPADPAPANQVASGVVPTPKAAPARTAAARTAVAAAAPVASIAAPAPAAVAETDIAAAAAPTTAAAAQATAAPAQGANVAAAQTAQPALGFAPDLPEDSDAGFFDAVAKRSQGLFRGVGKILN